MKSKIRYVVIFMFISLVLFACSSYNPIDKETLKEIEDFYIESVEKILTENRLTGEIEMKLSGEMEEVSTDRYHGNYMLRVTSNEFASLTSEQKLSFIDELDGIRYDNWKVTVDVSEEIISNGSTYEARYNGELYRDNTKIFPWKTEFYSSSPSSSSSSTCDTLRNNLDEALLLSGGETTDLTVYYTQALMDNDCFD